MEENTKKTQKQTENAIGKENKIVTGVIWQQLLLFFFPILFGTFFQQLYNAADAVIVGRFVGKEALSWDFLWDCPAVPQSLSPSIMGQNVPRW